MMIFQNAVITILLISHTHARAHTFTCYTHYTTQYTYYIPIKNCVI